VLIALSDGGRLTVRRIGFSGNSFWAAGVSGEAGEILSEPVADSGGAAEEK